MHAAATKSPLENYLFSSSEFALFVMKKNIFNVMQGIISSGDLLSFAIDFLINRK
jgi:hypothetical protein